MGSEEYEPDARTFINNATVEQIGGGTNASVFTYDGGNAVRRRRGIHRVLRL